MERLACEIIRQLSRPDTYSSAYSAKPSPYLMRSIISSSPMTCRVIHNFKARAGRVSSMPNISGSITSSSEAISSKYSASSPKLCSR
uniref:Uncharacterized protein n=1 Tax=Staphylococcus aureus TaxID=1280 RepID=C1PH91_STAAU|nr:hypothetical protein [Staphylococcus aureus PM1]